MGVYLKYLARRLYFLGPGKHHQKIVVASTGRAGSTMLFDAIADGWCNHRLGRLGGLFETVCNRLAKGFVERIDSMEYAPYVVCKTHDSIDENPDLRVKYVFVYGDPLESAMSVEQMIRKGGTEWFAKHQYHLRANGSIEDLFRKDVLNYAGQMAAWKKVKDFDNVFCVSFSDLWARENDLSDFLGFEIELPTKRERTQKHRPPEVNMALFDELRRISLNFR